MKNKASTANASHFAIVAAPAAMPAKPKTPATIEITKKIKVHFSDRRPPVSHEANRRNFHQFQRSNGPYVASMMPPIRREHPLLELNMEQALVSALVHRLGGAGRYFHS